MNTVNVQTFELNADGERVEYGAPRAIKEKKALELVKRFPKQYKIVSGIPHKVEVPKFTEPVAEQVAEPEIKKTSKKK